MNVTVRNHFIEDEKRQRIKPDGNTKRVYKPTPRQPSHAVSLLLMAVKAHKWPEPVIEHVFHPFRKWRLDIAWPELKLGIEVDGAVYAGGRHTRGKGFESDCEKLNQAQLIGWRVFRYSTGQVHKGLYLDDLQRIFGG